LAGGAKWLGGLFSGFGEKREDKITNQLANTTPDLGNPQAFISLLTSLLSVIKNNPIYTTLYAILNYYVQQYQAAIVVQNKESSDKGSDKGSDKSNDNDKNNAKNNEKNSNSQSQKDMKKFESEFLSTTLTISDPTISSSVGSRTSHSNVMTEHVILTNKNEIKIVVPLLVDLLAGANLPIYIICTKLIANIINDGLLQRLPNHYHLNRPLLMVTIDEDVLNAFNQTAQKTGSKLGNSTTIVNSTSMMNTESSADLGTSQSDHLGTNLNSNRSLHQNLSQVLSQNCSNLVKKNAKNSILALHDASSPITPTHLLQLPTTNVNQSISSQYLYTLTAFDNIYDIITHLSLSLIFTSSQPRLLFDQFDHKSTSPIPSSGHYDKIHPSSPLLSTTGQELLLTAFKVGKFEFKIELFKYFFCQFYHFSQDLAIVQCLQYNPSPPPPTPVNAILTAQQRADEQSGLSNGAKLELMEKIYKKST